MFAAGKTNTHPLDAKNTSIVNGTPASILDSSLDLSVFGTNNAFISKSSSSDTSLADLTIPQQSSYFQVGEYGKENTTYSLREYSADDQTIEGSEKSDTLIGGSGNDTLLGFEGWDILSGEDGDDRLDGGGEDSDTLIGGAGSDTFVIGDSQGIGYRNYGNAVITDWNGSEDHIEAKGSASLYRLVSQEYPESGTSALDTLVYFGDDLICVVEDSTDVNFEQHFIFV